MTACATGCSEVPLPAGWGHAVLHARSHGAEAGVTRSYDAHGRVLAWRPPSLDGGWACDVEASTTEAPALAARFGCSGGSLLQRWVLTETVAKLLDVPVLAFSRQHGLLPESPVGVPFEAPGFGRRIRLLALRPAALGAYCAFGVAG